MTAPELRAVLSDLAPLGITPARVAALWGYRSHTSLRQMQDGTQHVPPDLAAWLLALHRWWENHAPPANSR